MKNNKKSIYVAGAFIISILFIIGVFIVGDNISIDFSLETLRSAIAGRPFAEVFFIGLWSVRLIAFIPGVTLMLLGGLIFEADKAFVLSLLGIVLSDTIVFLVGKGNILKGFRKKITNKHPDLISLLEIYNYKILAIGVLCPIAPTDVIVFLSSYMGMKFIKFVSIFVISNLPALFLYSYLGESFNGSVFNTVMIIVTLSITAIFSIKLWNELRNKLAS